MSTKDVLVPRPLPTSSPHVLAPDGQARAEGVVAILVARLSDAVRNNDPIMPVIRSTCPSSDGRTTTMLQASSTSHQALIRKCYSSAGINDLGRTAMVEYHGTGTPVGDPLEAAAVVSACGEYGGVYIGSV